MSQKLDPIAEALNIAPLEVSATSVQVINNPIEDDYQYARSNIINIIDKGQEALNDLLNVAQASQHPRGYEVIATLIKTVSEANKDLLELAKSKKAVEGDKQPQKVTNNLFVGSTAELQKMLKDVDDKK